MSEIVTGGTGGVDERFESDGDNYEEFRETMGSVGRLVNEIVRIDAIRQDEYSVATDEILTVAHEIAESGKELVDEDILFSGMILKYGDRFVKENGLEPLPSTEEVVMHG